MSKRPPAESARADGGTVSAAESEDDNDLVFRWRAKRGHVFALAFFLGVAGLVHATGFYLFQVKPNVGSRVDAQPAKVVMLDPSDPTTAAILRDVDDRLLFLRPASIGSPSRLSIEDYAVTFQPSFMQRRVPFRGPGAGDSADEALSELLPPGGLVLPPVEKYRPAADPLPAPASPDEAGNRRWRISGELESRGVRPGSADTLDATLPVLPSGPSVRLQIWVDAAGRVVHLLPLSGSGQASIDEITALLRDQLRFAPRPERSLQAGELSLFR